MDSMEKTRLKEWRQKRGMTLQAVADAVGANRQTIHRLETGGQQLTEIWMRRLAPAFGVRPSDLLNNDDLNLKLTDTNYDSDPLGGGRSLRAASGLAQIVELDLEPGAGSGGRLSTELFVEGEDVVERIPIRRVWQMPADLASHVTASQSERIKILTVRGTSMVPDYIPGDKIMVDTADTMPSPPGNFIVWDGLNLVIKFVQFIPHSDPPTVKLTSRHQDIEPYERALDEAYIQGRVIGKWLWT